MESAGDSPAGKMGCWAKQVAMLFTMVDSDQHCLTRIRSNPGSEADVIHWRGSWRGIDHDLLSTALWHWLLLSFKAWKKRGSAR